MSVYAVDPTRPSAIKSPVAITSGEHDGPCQPMPRYDCCKNCSNQDLGCLHNYESAEDCYWCPRGFNRVFDECILCGIAKCVNCGWVDGSRPEVQFSACGKCGYQKCDKCKWECKSCNQAVCCSDDKECLRCDACRATWCRGCEKNKEQAADTSSCDCCYTGRWTLILMTQKAHLKKEPEPEPIHC